MEGRDEAAYVAGKRAVTSSNTDFEAEAMQLARAYLASQSVDGTEEAMQALWSFFKGMYDAQAAGEVRAQNQPA